MIFVEGIKEKFFVIYGEFYDDVEIGFFILFDDGLIGFEVIEKDEVNCELVIKVFNLGVFKNKKGVNVLNVFINLLGIIEKDVVDICFGLE